MCIVAVTGISSDSFLVLLFAVSFTAMDETFLSRSGRGRRGGEYCSGYVVGEVGSVGADIFFSGVGIGVVGLDVGADAGGAAGYGVVMFWCRCG